MLYGYPNHDGVIQTTLETAGIAPAGYIPIDSQDKIGWRHIDGSFLPPLPPPPTPITSVTRRQFKQGLTRIGLRVAVEAAIAAADQDTKDWYFESTSFERANPVMNSMASALGKTQEDIDNLFRLAATL
jgi:hypothetical protein